MSSFLAKFLRLVTCGPYLGHKCGLVDFWFGNMPNEKVSQVGICWDANHHIMAAWDDHPACRSCMCKTGITCSESKPCGVCRTWSPDLWTKVKIADLRSANRRINRAKANLQGEIERSGSVWASCPRIGDSGAFTPERCDSPTRGSA